MNDETPEEELIRLTAEWPSPSPGLRRQIVASAVKTQRRRHVARQASSAVLVTVAVVGLSVWNRSLVLWPQQPSSQPGTVRTETDSPRPLAAENVPPSPSPFRQKQTPTDEQTPRSTPRASVEVAAGRRNSEWHVFQRKIRLLRRRADYFQ